MAITVSNEAQQQFAKIKLPERVYVAALASLRTVEMDDSFNPGQKTTKVVWAFDIAGKQNTYTIEALTNLNSSLGNEKSKNRMFWKALTGGDPPTSGTSDLEELVGLKCQIRLKDHQNQKGETYSIIADAFALDAGEEV